MGNLGKRITFGVFFVVVEIFTDMATYTLLFVLLTDEDLSSSRF